MTIEIIDDFENRATEIVSNAPSYSNLTPWKLQYDVDVSYSIGIMSPHCINLLIHLVKGVGAVICNKMYFRSDDPEATCDECKKPGYKGKGFAKPFSVRCYIGYCFDLIDKVETNQKTGKQFTHNPIKVVEIWAGQNNGNFEFLDEATLGGYLTFENGPEPTIWRMRRNSPAKGGGMEPPAVLSRPEILSKGPQVKGGKFQIPEADLEKFLSKSKGEVIGLLMSGYGNLNKEYLTKRGYIFPETSNPISTEAEEETNSSTDIEESLGT